MACQPGGEWDVRTRFARIVEALNVATRLDYTYRANVAEGIMLVRFGHSVVDAMPQREYDAREDVWRELDENARVIWAAEHDARVALTLAAACFAAGACIARCYVQIAAPDAEQGERVIATYSFGRAAYLADCVPVAKDLESMDMDDMPCKRVLEHMSQPLRRRLNLRRFMLVRVMTIACCRRRCAICCLPIRLTSWRSWKRTTTHTWPVLLNCASRQ